MTNDIEIDVSLPIAGQKSLEPVFAQLSLAEELGYAHAWLPESWGRDCTTTLGRMAERTDRIGLGTSVMPIYSRSPALVGQSAATLQEASDGRFRLGLGMSSPDVIEGWHSLSHERPLRALREYIEIVQQVVRGEQLSYEGSIYSPSGPQLRFDPPDPPSPVDAAALGPKAVELVGRFADGWNVFFFTPEGLKQRMEHFERGLSLGKRDPDDVRVMSVVICYVSDDPEVAREKARRHLAFFIGAYGPFYRSALESQGYEEVVDNITTAWKREAYDVAREHAGALLDEDLVAAGTPEEARQVVARHAAIEGVDAVTVGFPQQPDNERVIDTIEALAPGQLGVDVQ